MFFFFFIIILYVAWIWEGFVKCAGSHTDGRECTVETAIWGKRKTQKFLWFLILNWGSCFCVSLPVDFLIADGCSGRAELVGFCHKWLQHTWQTPGSSQKLRYFSQVGVMHSCYSHIEFRLIWIEVTNAW